MSSPRRGDHLAPRPSESLLAGAILAVMLEMLRGNVVATSSYRQCKLGLGGGARGESGGPKAEG